MDFQIHCMETEAYGAVLRAFIAQSGVLSWGKEVFITDLRKELRVSDVEHREILGKLNLDDSIKSIREHRKSIDGQQLIAMNPLVSIPMFEGHESCKKLKPAQMPVASSPKYPQHTRTSQVENTFGGVNPHLCQVERENVAFREHERALTDAIGKLTEVSDDDDSLGHRQKQNRYCNVDRGMTYCTIYPVATVLFPMTSYCYSDLRPSSRAAGPS